MAAADLGKLFDQLSAFDRPPVDTWHPEKTVDLDMRIARGGQWFHEGEVIPRTKLVKLFATVLVLRDGEYFLVTPPARFRIRVDDLPFMAVELRAAGEGEKQSLYFRTNMDEVVLADRDHPLRVETDPTTGQPSPSVHVRDGLYARLTRPVFYELAELCTALEHDQADVGVHSAGQFFRLE